jgi:DNA primase
LSTLNEKQRALLTEAAERYSRSLTPQALSYLEGRGITQEVASTYLLGSVLNPAAGHELGAGMLSIPYLTPAGVVGIKFRRIDNGTPKYLWPTGQKIGLFNVTDLHRSSDTIAICEGEIDTIVLSGVIGIPSVGVAGVSQWKPWFPKLFESYSRILIFADNDVKEDGRNPGQELAKRIKEDLDKADIVHLPDNTDVNDVYLRYGSEWFSERLAA